MVKLTGQNKLRTAVFISGAGSNLKNLMGQNLSQKGALMLVKEVF